MLRQRHRRHRHWSSSSTTMSEDQHHPHKLAWNNSCGSEPIAVSVNPFADKRRARVVSFHSIRIFLNLRDLWRNLIFNEFILFDFWFQIAKSTETTSGGDTEFFNSFKYTFASDRHKWRFAMVFGTIQLNVWVFASNQCQFVKCK